MNQGLGASGSSGPSDIFVFNCHPNFFLKHSTILLDCTILHRPASEVKKVLLAKVLWLNLTSENIRMTASKPVSLAMELFLRR